MKTSWKIIFISEYWREVVFIFWCRGYLYLLNHQMMLHRNPPSLVKSGQSRDVWLFKVFRPHSLERGFEKWPIVSCTVIHVVLQFPSSSIIWFKYGSPLVKQIWVFWSQNSERTQRHVRRYMQVRTCPGETTVSIWLTTGWWRVYRQDSAFSLWQGILSSCLAAT